ncbi:hypothetical protein AMECASPLE_038446 [Ameca splendens]|uniref:Uncharacterized protein n=1 Tax=Ameca splendens TaxID=208324 RepID=A0ABV0Y8C8_9TELE
MALERENAAKLELSRAEERTEKAEAEYDDLKVQALKKASSQKVGQTPTSQVPHLHFHSLQPQQEADSDNRYPVPTESPLPKLSPSVQLTSTDLNRSVGSHMISNGVLPNPIAVNNHQADRVPDSACAGGPIGWKEQPSNLIWTPLPSDSVSTPRG